MADFQKPSNPAPTGMPDLPVDNYRDRVVSTPQTSAPAYLFGRSGRSRNIQSGQPGNSPDSYDIHDGRGHEFQNDQGHDLPLNALARTPRNMFPKSVRIYGNDPGGIVTAALANTDPAVPFDWRALLLSMQRKANFVPMPFQYTTAPTLVLPRQDRTYLIIQNLDAAANLFVGPSFKPDGVNGIGLRVAPGAAYEPFEVPQNDIWLAGSAPGNCFIIYANG